MSYRILNFRAVRALCTVGGLLISFNALADSIVVPVPCATSGGTSASPTAGTGASGTGGLRFCKDVLYAPAASPTPGLLAVISNNVAAPTNPALPDQRGTLQKYADCYYKGYELDASGIANLAISPSANVCTLGNPTKVHNFCSIVPNHLNNNISEGSIQNPNNAAGTSCGQFAQIKTSIQSNCPISATLPIPIANLPTPTASQAAILAQNGLSLPGLQNPALTDQQINQLATQAGVTTQQAQAASSGQSVCVAFTLPQPNPGATPADPSWERTQLAGTYMLALSSNSDEVLNELSCQQSLTIDTTSGCYALAKEVQGLGTQLASISAQLGQAANVGDIDYCQASFSSTTGTGAVAPTTANLTGNLRQSASFLCSARAKLEAAFGQLAMCDIFSRAQNDYLSKTGTPALQAQFFTTMTNYMDNGNSVTNHAGICGQQCKGSKSIGSLQSCLNSCYQANVRPYFQTTLSSSNYWPQPTQVNTSCVGGGKVYVGN